MVFPVLHGPYGEDGTIQGLLELADLPYVGPGVLASAAAMDKEFTKKLLAAEGLPVGPYAVLRPGVATLTDADRERLGLPVFVKPARAGSSLGRQPGGRLGRPGRRHRRGPRRGPEGAGRGGDAGREIECGVLEFPDGRVEASPPAEIHVQRSRVLRLRRQVSRRCRHLRHPGDAARRRSPRPVRELAVAAFRALDAQGLARVDFFVTDDGRGADQRGQHHAGFHADLDVPADVDRPPG